MIGVGHLLPVNILEEKEKFFSNHQYNPQFIYQDEFAADDIPAFSFSDELLSFSNSILERTLSEFGSFENYNSIRKGTELSLDEVKHAFNQYLKSNHLDKQYALVFSDTFQVRTTLSTKEIKIKTPVHYGTNDIKVTLNHEIGTHALRRFNNNRQPWYKKRTHYGLESPLETEEGLASIHSLIEQSDLPPFKSALLYSAAHAAQALSFFDLYQKVFSLTQNQELSWVAAFRQKRGLRDTAQPGGFLKDSVYIKGLVRVWQYLKKNNWDSAPLYWGKIDINDVKKALEISPDFSPKLPHFLKNQELYAQKVETIGLKLDLDKVQL